MIDESVENLTRFTFGVLRLNSVIDSVTAWMTGGRDSFAECSTEDRITAANHYFEAHPDHKWLAGPYVELIQEAKRLKKAYKDFLEGACEGSITKPRQDTTAALERLAGIMEGLGLREQATSLRATATMT